MLTPLIKCSQCQRYVILRYSHDNRVESVEKDEEQKVISARAESKRIRYRNVTDAAAGVKRDANKGNIRNEFAEEKGKEKRRRDGGRRRRSIVRMIRREIDILNRWVTTASAGRPAQ